MYELGSGWASNLLLKIENIVECGAGRQTKGLSRSLTGVAEYMSPSNSWAGMSIAPMLATVTRK
jgi:hypothetical protein